MDPRQEIEQLTRELEYHNRQYYVLDDPKIDDYTYDHILRRLEDLEKEYPQYASPTSPTRRVGGEAISAFQKVQHAVPLESLQDVFSLDELREFDARVRARGAGGGLFRRAEGGRPVRGAGVPRRRVRARRHARRRTHRRGRDGKSQDHPLHSRCGLRARRPGSSCAARCSCRARRSTRSTTQREEAGKPPLCQSAQRRSGLAAPARPEDRGEAPPGHSGLQSPARRGARRSRRTARRWIICEALALQGHPAHALPRRADEPRRIIEDLNETRYTLLLRHRRRGHEAEQPRRARTHWAARRSSRAGPRRIKYPPGDQDRPVLQDIVVQVGRTGVLTPRAVVAPVHLAGTTVTKPRRSTIRTSSRKRTSASATPSRSGRRGRSSPKFSRSSWTSARRAPCRTVCQVRCPVCGAPVVRDEDGVALRCTGAECPAQLSRNLRTFRLARGDGHRRPRQRDHRHAHRAEDDRKSRRPLQSGFCKVCGAARTGRKVGGESAKGHRTPARATTSRGCSARLAFGRWDQRQPRCWR